MAQEQELLRKLGEETLYSAKGHFKACDLRRQLVTYTIWMCAVLNVASLFNIHPMVDKLLAAAAVFGTIALLTWNEGENKNYRAKHKQAAETYLALYKEIRTCFLLDNCNQEDVAVLAKKVSDFDQNEKQEIPGFARRWAKHAIEKKDAETDNWFLKR